ncbi:substrate-binding domain-containing protein [Plebeiibacterium marinum]|uniref:Substrate-binding domain-containing protein n=1 Tax=Plebeiibacterium marinum TaxID=2992111 RepID=A0AAE3MIL2_9BACT|nr:substrate-binding domain-containing protein [Plebeiobacterium marinum]MCW3807752.1 substrate-binding domain-containing protein [Plebeiobacterium marinum]
MKKIIILLLSSFVFLISQKAVAQRDSIHVGFVMANLYSERWQRDMTFFKERLNQLGAKVTFVDCFDNEEQQIKAAQKLINMQVACLVVIPVNSRNTEIVSIAKSASIPIVSYDRFILDPNLDLCVTYNSISVGKLMAESVNAKLPKGNILYVGGPTSDYNSSLVRKGVFSVLNNFQQNYTISAIRTHDWNEMDAFLTVQKFVEKHGYIPDAIISASDVLTKGILLFLEAEADGKKVLLTGQDGSTEICKEILNDRVLMTVYKPNKELAYKTAESVIKLLNKQTLLMNNDANNMFLDVPTVMMEPSVLTKENVVEVIGQAIISNN